MRETKTRLQARWWARAGAALVISAAFAGALAAQTYTTLFTFDFHDGFYPSTALLQAPNGNLYGGTIEGGPGCAPNGCGTLFEITPGGAFTTVYNFCSEPNCADGAGPGEALVLGTDGNIYGVTSGGGKQYPCIYGGCGTIFRFTSAGELTTLYTFCSQQNCADGAGPIAGLALAGNGNFYGTTSSYGTYFDGSAFEMTPAGALTTLLNFDGATDGADSIAGMIQGTDGNLYGAMLEGGSSTSCASVGCGTIFKMTLGGTFTLLHDFCTESGCPDGASPYGGVVEGPDGNFYGTTYSGGAYGYGTVFEITPAGVLTVVHSFCSRSLCSDGKYPFAGLVRGSDGAFYGTTGGGGTNGNGTIFRITSSGALTVLHNFEPGEGGGILVPMTQATNGIFYGVTGLGGARKSGTIFALSVGLGPFVETVPISGRTGEGVRILGTDLAGATGVTFNGVEATFKVLLNSEIEATVPEGATTGAVEVVTPGGTLSSNAPFVVRP